MRTCLKELQEKLADMGLKTGEILYVGSDVLYLLYEAREKYGVETPDEQDAFLMNWLTHYREQWEKKVH